MRINEVIEIVHATLINQPRISYFCNITARLEEVGRETLFLARDQASSQEAIALGAYGIIFEDGALEVIDEECAWFKVDSLLDALTRLIRYKLLSRGISVIFLKQIEFEIAQEISTDVRVEFLRGGYDDFLSSTQKPCIEKIITNNPILLNVPLDVTEGIIPEVEPFKIISCTLFDSKIYFDSKRFTLSLPSIFLGYLASVIRLFENEQIVFSLSHFEHICYFRPLFVTPQNTLCAYGQSGRVLLAEEDANRFDCYATYLLENAKWAKMLFFLPRQSASSLSPYPFVSYEDKEELLPLIAEHRFNFALILGVGSEFLLQRLKDPLREASLFDE